jgi:hypothetical protein
MKFDGSLNSLDDSETVVRTASKKQDNQTNPLQAVLTGYKAIYA